MEARNGRIRRSTLLEGSRVFLQDLPNAVRLEAESESHTRLAAVELGSDWGLDLE